MLGQILIKKTRTQLSVHVWTEAAMLEDYWEMLPLGLLQALVTFLDVFSLINTRFLFLLQIPRFYVLILCYDDRGRKKNKQHFLC